MPPNEYSLQHRRCFYTISDVAHHSLCGRAHREGQRKTTGDKKVTGDRKSLKTRKSLATGNLLTIQALFITPLPKLVSAQLSLGS